MPGSSGFSLSLNLCNSNSSESLPPSLGNEAQRIPEGDGVYVLGTVAKWELFPIPCRVSGMEPMNYTREGSDVGVGVVSSQVTQSPVRIVLPTSKNIQN